MALIAFRPLEKLLEGIMLSDPGMKKSTSALELFFK